MITDHYIVMGGMNTYRASLSLSSARAVPGNQNTNKKGFCTVHSGVTDIEVKVTLVDVTVETNCRWQKGCHAALGSSQPSATALASRGSSPKGSAVHEDLSTREQVCAGGVSSASEREGFFFCGLA